MSAQQRPRPLAPPTDAPPPRDPATVLRLPHVDDRTLPGARIARRAVLLTLAGFALLAALALLAVALVTVPVIVQASGSLEPVHVIPVRAEESGVIARVDVADGDTVRAGQPLVSLDTLGAASALAELEALTDAQRAEAERLARTVSIEREQAEVALMQANARLLRARAALRQRLADLGLGGNDLDSLLTAYRRGTHVGIDAAVADVELARADVAGVRVQFARVALAPLEAEKQAAETRRLAAQTALRRAALARRVVRAPAEGVVLTDGTERLLGTAVREGVTILELADPSEWHVAVAVRERDVPRVSRGDGATVEVPALASLYDKPLRARVSRLATDVAGGGAVAPAVEGARDRVGGAAPAPFHVYLTLDRAQLDTLGLTALRRGYSARVKIVTRHVRAITLLREWLGEHLPRGGV